MITKSSCMRWMARFVVSLCTLAVVMLTSDLAKAQSSVHVDIIQGGELWDVDGNTGAYTQIGPNNIWTGAVAFASDELQRGWIVDDDALWQVPLGASGFEQLGTEEWLGPTLLAYGFHTFAFSPSLPSENLYAHNANRLWRVNLTTGVSTQIGNETWPNTTSIGFLRWSSSDLGWLYVIQGGSLWRVNVLNGNYVRLGPVGDWAGSTHMIGAYGELYVIHGSSLWRVNFAGVATLMSTGWSAVKSLTQVLGTAYIVDGQTLWKQTETGGIITNLGSGWTGTIRMAGHWTFH